MLAQGENLDNFKEILSEYNDALLSKENIVKKLYNEIKIIKRLKV